MEKKTGKKRFFVLSFFKMLEIGLKTVYSKDGNKGFGNAVFFCRKNKGDACKQALARRVFALPMQINRGKGWSKDDFKSGFAKYD